MELDLRLWGKLAGRIVVRRNLHYVFARTLDHTFVVAVILAPQHRLQVVILPYGRALVHIFPGLHGHFVFAEVGL